MPVPVVVNRLKFVNSWLVREDDGLTLIDANIGGTADRILARARDLGAPIVRIAITHAHPDHIGSLDALADKLPGVEVLHLRARRPAARRRRQQDPHEPEGSKLRGMKVEDEAHGAPRARRAGRLAGGRRGARPHARARRAARHPRPHPLLRRRLLDVHPRRDERRDEAADAAALAGHVAQPTELASARALRALDPARLAPGHGRLVEAPGAAMDAALGAPRLTLYSAARNSARAASAVSGLSENTPSIPSP